MAAGTYLQNATAGAADVHNAVGNADLLCDAQPPQSQQSTLDCRLRGRRCWKLKQFRESTFKMPPPPQLMCRAPSAIPTSVTAWAWLPECRPSSSRVSITYGRFGFRMVQCVIIWRRLPQPCTAPVHTSGHASGHMSTGIRIAAD